MEINDLQKWNIALDIHDNFDFGPLLLQLESINFSPVVTLIKKRINFSVSDIYTPLNFKLAIIDFEGSPTILIGLMINNTILTYYIDDHEHLYELNKTLLEILFITQKISIFCFSEYEQQEILRIYTTLNEQGLDLSKYSFISSLSLVNLQKHRFESVTEAMFSTNSKIDSTGDPLFRNIKVIDKLFTINRLQEIIAHNYICLLNESIILRRWIKYYNISEINETR